MKSKKQKNIEIYKSLEKETNEINEFKSILRKKKNLLFFQRGLILANARNARKGRMINI